MHNKLKPREHAIITIIIYINFTYSSEHWPGLRSKQLSSKCAEHKHDDFFGTKSFLCVRTNRVHFCRKLSSVGKYCIDIPGSPVLFEKWRTKITNSSFLPSSLSCPPWHYRFQNHQLRHFLCNLSVLAEREKDPLRVAKSKLWRSKNTRKRRFWSLKPWYLC